MLFTLLTCTLEKEDFEASRPLAGILKHSANRYYSYFGTYAETMICGKLEGIDSQAADRKYAETIAYFRSQSMAEPGNMLAPIFRARLYAEQKKFAKAEEISNLLGAEDRKAVLAYIDQCRKS